MKYKNYGYVEKTFYGVTFKPGETHEVPGYITARNFIPVYDVAEDEVPQLKRKVGRPAKTSTDSQNNVETEKGSDKESKEKE